MQIAFAKVTGRRSFVALIDAVKKSISAENPSASKGYIDALDQIRRSFNRAPRAQHLSMIAGSFGAMRGIASAAGAPQTAGAVGQAAAWFTANAPGIAAADTRYRAPAVVKQGPSVPVGTRRPSPTYRPPAAPPAAPPSTQTKTPITKRVWFVPVVVGSVGLLLAGGILLAGRK